MIRKITPAMRQQIHAIEKLKFGYDDLLLYSDHTSGGNQYGSDARHAVTDEWGRLFGTENVAAADSSLFPSAPGINPSWTIKALARRNALHTAAEKGEGLTTL